MSPIVVVILAALTSLASANLRSQGIYAEQHASHFKHIHNAQSGFAAKARLPKSVTASSDREETTNVSHGRVIKTYDAPNDSNAVLKGAQDNTTSNHSRVNNLYHGPPVEVGQQVESIAYNVSDSSSEDIKDSAYTSDDVEMLEERPTNSIKISDGHQSNAEYAKIIDDDGREFHQVQFSSSSSSDEHVSVVGVISPQNPVDDKLAASEGTERTFDDGHSDIPHSPRIDLGDDLIENLGDREENSFQSDHTPIEAVDPVNEESRQHLTVSSLTDSSPIPSQSEPPSQGSQQQVPALSDLKPTPLSESLIGDTYPDIQLKVQSPSDFKPNPSQSEPSISDSLPDSRQSLNPSDLGSNPSHYESSIDDKLPDSTQVVEPSDLGPSPFQSEPSISDIYLDSQDQISVPPNFEPTPQSEPSIDDVYPDSPQQVLTLSDFQLNPSQPEPSVDDTNPDSRQGLEPSDLGPTPSQFVSSIDDTNSDTQQQVTVPSDFISTPSRPEPSIIDSHPNSRQVLEASDSGPIPQSEPSIGDSYPDTQQQVPAPSDFTLNLPQSEPSIDDILPESRPSLEPSDLGPTHSQSEASIDDTNSHIQEQVVAPSNFKPTSQSEASIDDTDSDIQEQVVTPSGIEPIPSQYKPSSRHTYPDTHESSVYEANNGNVEREANYGELYSTDASDFPVLPICEVVSNQIRLQELVSQLPRVPRHWRDGGMSESDFAETGTKSDEAGDSNGDDHSYYWFVDYVSDLTSFHFGGAAFSLGRLTVSVFISILCLWLSVTYQRLQSSKRFASDLVARLSKAEAVAANLSLERKQSEQDGTPNDSRVAVHDASLVAMTQTLQAENDQLRLTIDRQTMQLSDMETQLQNAIQSPATSSDEIDAVHAELAELKNKYDQTIDEVNRSRRMILNCLAESSFQVHSAGKSTSRASSSAGLNDSLVRCGSSLSLNSMSTTADCVADMSGLSAMGDKYVVGATALAADWPLSDAVDLLRSRLLMQYEQIVKADSRTRRRESEIKSKSKIVRDLKSCLSKAETQLLTAREERDKMMNKLADMSTLVAEVESLKTQLSAVQQRNETLSTEKADMEKLVDASKQQVAVSERQVQLLEQLQASQQSNPHASEVKAKDLGGWDDDLDDLCVGDDNANGDEASSVFDQIASLANLQCQLASVQAECRQTAAEAETARQNEAQLAETVSKLEEEIRFMRRAAAQAADEKQSVENRLSVLTEYFGQREVEMTKQIGLTATRLSDTQSATAVAEDELASLSRQLEDKDEEVKRLKSEVLENERLVKQKTYEAQRKQHESWLAVREKTREVTDLQSKVDSLELALQQKQSELDLLSRQREQNASLTAAQIPNGHLPPPANGGSGDTSVFKSTSAGLLSADMIDDPNDDDDISSLPHLPMLFMPSTLNGASTGSVFSQSAAGFAQDSL